MSCSRGFMAAVLLAAGIGAIVGAGTAPAQQDGQDPKAKKEAFDPGAIKTLQATLPSGWKDDETFLGVHSFLKDDKEKAYVFAFLYNDPAPKTPEALAELAKKKRFLWGAANASTPLRYWAKTTGIGKLPDGGVFIVGKGTAQGSTEEEDTLGAVRTINGKTVLFLAVPAVDAATRKEQLGIIRSARFGPG